MSPLTGPLLVLAVVALLQGASAVPRKIGYACTTVLHGITEGFVKNLDTVYINAGVQAASIDIPNPCSGTINGEQVTVCDDVPPTVIAPDLPKYSPVTVYRNGNYDGQFAPVSVTFWCASP